MHFATPTIMLLAAILTKPAQAGYNCYVSPRGLKDIRYEAQSDRYVSNVPKVCGDLWDNLKKYSGCRSPSETNFYSDSRGYLQWDFSPGSGCTPSNVQDAWWFATENRYGFITCNRIRQET
jgi:hypothetical protein